MKKASSGHFVAVVSLRSVFAEHLLLVGESAGYVVINQTGSVLMELRVYGGKRM